MMIESADKARRQSDREGVIQRRRFIQGGFLTGATLLTGSVRAQTGGLDPSWRVGRTLQETGGYGSPSRFVHDSRLKSEGGYGLLGDSLTPLERGYGIVTPSGIHQEVHHNGVPVIEPDQHRLFIHGLVNSSKVFTMANLKRFPSVSRFHFLECAGNTVLEVSEPR